LSRTNEMKLNIGFRFLKCTMAFIYPHWRYLDATSVANFWSNLQTSHVQSDVIGN
jgi:hypothetical protein